MDFKLGEFFRLSNRLYADHVRPMKHKSAVNDGKRIEL